MTTGYTFRPLRAVAVAVAVLVCADQSGIMSLAWIESTGAVLLAAGGAWVGYWCSRQKSAGWWSLGYGLPLLLIILVGVGRRRPELEFVFPFSWLLTGRSEFAVGGPIIASLLVTPLSRLPRSRDRWAVATLGALLISTLSVWPFFAPVLNHRQLASIRTRMDPDGVCRQNTDFTCGPAAAVTLLRHLGLPADEGEIAILAHSSSAIGTPPDLLCAALQKRYRTNGLECEYRHFRSTTELNRDGLTLAVIRFAFLMDHYVAILKVSDQEILVGDPLDGEVTYSHEALARKWRGTGVVLRRVAP